MQDGLSDHFDCLAPAAIVSHRTKVSLAWKFVGGAALSVIGGARLAQLAAAQDDEIVLTAAASEVGARPGSAYAQGFAALAAADHDAGAITATATSPAPGGGTSETEDISFDEDEVGGSGKGP